MDNNSEENTVTRQRGISIEIDDSLLFSDKMIDTLTEVLNKNEDVSVIQFVISFQRTTINIEKHVNNLLTNLNNNTIFSNAEFSSMYKAIKNTEQDIRISSRLFTMLRCDVIKENNTITELVNVIITDLQKQLNRFIWVH